MGIGMITKLNEEMNHERLKLIALGRAKEKELGRKPGELFSTLISRSLHLLSRAKDGEEWRKDHQM